jgi:acyl-CoA reductase-like NAD-dependent aldehyde dehydrogenase
LAFRATVFGAVGTCGQRCTSQRRTFIHESIYDQFVDRLVKAYPKLVEKMGDPLDSNTLLGPLHNKLGLEGYLRGLEEIKE